MIHATSMANSPSDSWFVLWTESRAEKQVAARIAAHGIEPWLPTVTERRRWSDRWRNVVFPLFPGYLFARATAGQLGTLLRTPGVMTVVKDGGRAARLSDSFIASLRHALEHTDVQAQALSDEIEFSRGDEVIVRDGPLAGVRGIVQDVRNGRRLVVWVREIGRGVAFTIGSALVSSMSRPDGAPISGNTAPPGRTTTV
jgi:transcription termination/antitermination protein NusG